MLKKNEETIADPEAREKTTQALVTLRRVGNVGPDDKIPEKSTASEIPTVAGHLKAILEQKHAAKIPQALQYACTYWVQHLEKLSCKQRQDMGLSDGGEIDKFLRANFLFWLETTLHQELSSGSL